MENKGKILLCVFFATFVIFLLFPNENVEDIIDNVTLPDNITLPDNVTIPEDAIFIEIYMDNNTEEDIIEAIELSGKKVCYIYLENRTNSCGSFSGGSGTTETTTPATIPEFPLTMIPVFVCMLGLYMRRQQTTSL